MTPPTVALITVTYNSARELEEHWKDAAALGVPWIVVDNASDDGSADIAAGLGAEQVVRLPRNVGFSAANNVGVALTGADCLIFVNPDVRVDGDSARELAGFAVSRQALVAPQLLNSDLTVQENGRAAPFLYRKLSHFIGKGRQEYEVVTQPDELARISWAIGAAIAIPRAIFTEIGGWDSSFFIYYEDSDICLRARAKGHPVLLLGSVRWVHAWARATRRSFSLASWKFEFRSAARFYGRYPGLLLHPRLFRSAGRVSYRDERQIESLG